MSSITSTQLDAAVEALRQVMPMTQPADVALSQYFRDHHRLGPQDRHFVAETVFAVLRRGRMLEAIADKATPRQLILASLVRVRGMNMREMLALTTESEQKWLQQAKAVKLEDLSPAIQAELPDWMYEMLSPVMSPEELLALGRGLQQAAPLDLRVNTIKTSREQVLAELDYAGIQAVPTPYSPFGIRVNGKPPLNRLAVFLEGRVEVQDEGSQLLGLLLAPRRGEMVVDFCAGAGGKTLLLGALMNSSGRLYAFDVAEKRLNNLKPRLKRSGLSNVHPQLISSETDARVKRLAGKIDRVLVDAPCSGLGTLRRNPDLKFRQSAEGVAELTVKQTNILRSAAKLLKIGGRIVYATCSILPVENQAIVEAFLAEHPQFALVPAGEALAQQRVDLPMGDYLQLTPHQHGTDGFFAALLERQY